MNTDQFRVTPFGHQLSEYLGHRADRIRAIFWEQGTGKSKEAIDQACWLYTQGLIDALIVVAPDGVHSNWTAITETPETHGELQKHVWESVPWKAFTYHSSKASTKRHLAEGREVFVFDGLAVLAITYDAAITPTGKKVLYGFVNQRKSMMTLDESPRIKTPSSKRTRAMWTAGRRAPYKRILTGTPVPESPFDVYAQIKFLDEGFWKRNGIGTYTAFKAEFANMEMYQQDENGRWKLVAADVPEPEDTGQNDFSDLYGADAGAGWEGTTEADTRRSGVAFRPKANHFQKVVEFKNLDKLKAMLDTISTRVTKDDVLDLPPKLFQMRTFELTREQRRMYNELRDEAISWINSDQYVSGILPIVRLLRLQQITNGYVSPDGGEDVQDIEGGNPRLELFREVADDVGKGHPHIVWARFQRDIDNIVEACKRDDFTYVTYDGRTSPDDRERAKNMFQDGTVDKFIASQAAGSEGLTLTVSRRTTYYSNSFRLLHRLQSEDRNHRIGQRWPVLYDDLACPGTVDFKLVEALRGKMNIAAAVTGDGIKKWLI